MEHEYYTGLSLVLMVYYASKKLGPSLAAWLDKEVDVSSFYNIITCGPSHGPPFIPTYPRFF